MFKKKLLLFYDFKIFQVMRDGNPGTPSGYFRVENPDISWDLNSVMGMVQNDSINDDSFLVSFKLYLRIYKCLLKSRFGYKITFKESLLLF